MPKLTSHRYKEKRVTNCSICRSKYIGTDIRYDSYIRNSCLSKFTDLLSKYGRVVKDDGCGHTELERLILVKQVMEQGIREIDDFMVDLPLKEK